MMIKIVVNGKEEIIEKCTLQELIASKKIDQDALVAEYNFKIVTTKEWASIELSEDDNLELLSFVGGG